MGQRAELRAFLRHELGPADDDRGRQVTDWSSMQQALRCSRRLLQRASETQHIRLVDALGHASVHQGTASAVFVVEG